MTAVRGHGSKIREAVLALEACGDLPRNLRPVHRDRRVLDWLTRHGYAADLPSRTALGRYFHGSGYKAGKSGETVSADESGRTYVGRTSVSSQEFDRCTAPSRAKQPSATPKSFV
jgi:hypothetical protein